MLDVSPVLLLFTAIVFLTLLVVLNKMLYKPLLDFVTRRQEDIEDSLKSSGQNEQEVRNLEIEVENIIKQGQQEVSSLKAKAIDEAQKVSEEKIQEKKQELEQKYNEFLSNLENEKKEFKNGLLAQMPLYKEGLKAKINKI